VSDIRITVNDQTFTAQLADNPTARDLIDQLPLTLRFRDFNSVDKIAKLARPLTMDGVPPGDDPEIIDAEDMSLIERQPDGFELTIDRG
jgi:hypothetical protein